MSKKQICEWTGHSGTVYKFAIWALPADFAPNQVGNYIYAKRGSQEGKWTPIYIGEGDLQDRAENHHQIDCIESKGATHIHVHLNGNEQARLNEESDLLGRYTNAYTPVGCNEKLGG